MKSFTGSTDHQYEEDEEFHFFWWMLFFLFVLPLVAVLMRGHDLLRRVGK